MLDPNGRKVGATYLRNNFGKRSLGLDLKSPEGRDLFLALVPNFDVVAENFKPGTMDRMGLGYPDIAARHPRAVYVSISGFGNTVETPYRDWPAYASIVEAMSGIYDYRHPGEPPVTIPVGALGDISSGLFGVIGIFAALRQRDRTGVGQYVDIAMFDAIVAMTDIVTNFWSLGVRPEPDKGLEVICEGFRASDGYVVVQIVREHQFFKLAELIGRPEWKDDPRFATRSGWGPALESEIRPAVDAWASQRTKLAAAQELTSAGIVAGPSNRAPDVIADPHLAARHMIVEMPRTDGVERAGARSRQPGEAVEDDRRPRDARAVGRGAHRRGARGRARSYRGRRRAPARPRRGHLTRRTKSAVGVVVEPGTDHERQNSG